MRLLSNAWLLLHESVERRIRGFVYVSNPADVPYGTSVSRLETGNGGRLREQNEPHDARLLQLVFCSRINVLHYQILCCCYIKGYNDGVWYFEGRHR